MNGNENRYLGEEPVGSLMQKYAIPCIISLLVGALYNIVDQIFIANASYEFVYDLYGLTENEKQKVNIFVDSLKG